MQLYAKSLVVELKAAPFTLADRSSHRINTLNPN